MNEHLKAVQTDSELVADVILISLYLDPRFKKFAFISDGIRHGLLLSATSSLVAKFQSADFVTFPSLAGLFR
jgi:hypothetical protein